MSGSEVFFCLIQDGNVKISSFVNDKFESEQYIHEGETPVASLSQSLTGKYIFLGLASHN